MSPLNAQLKIITVSKPGLTTVLTFGMGTVLSSFEP